MKVLYIGYYRDGSGWAQAAQDWILALDAAGVDVVPRAYQLNNANPDIPERIEELAEKSDKNCDVVIQHLLPHHMDYNGHFAKNIGLFVSETSNFNNTSWSSRLNLMDEVWVTNHQMVNACRDSFIEKPVKIIPHASNVGRFMNGYEFDLPKYLDGKFVFYFIGEMNRRKNIGALLKAFHTEFDPDEPVALLIKSGMFGVSPSESSEYIRQTCGEIRQGLKLYDDLDDYNLEVVVTTRLSDKQICGLHMACDCYVGPSFGEAWNIPAFDAMGFGKTPICTDFGGPSDFIRRTPEIWNCRDMGGPPCPTNPNDPLEPTKYGGWLIPGSMEPVFGMIENTFKDLYVATEEWCAIDIAKMRVAMRTAYKDKEEKDKRADFGMERAMDFSYDKVGNVMLEALENDN
jgi:glycosyltransferase involved in cell wall biosynthesis